MTGQLGTSLSQLGRIELGTAESSIVTQSCGSSHTVLSSAVINILFGPAASQFGVTASASATVDDPRAAAGSMFFTQSSADCGQFAQSNFAMTCSVRTQTVQEQTGSGFLVASKAESSSGELANARYLR
jgi:hypothetical protein